MLTILLAAALTVLPADAPVPSLPRAELLPQAPAELTPVSGIGAERGAPSAVGPGTRVALEIGLGGLGSGAMAFAGTLVGIGVDGFLLHSSSFSWIETGFRGAVVGSAVGAFLTTWAVSSVCGVSSTGLVGRSIGAATGALIAGTLFFATGPALILLLPLLASLGATVGGELELSLRTTAAARPAPVSAAGALHPTAAIPVAAF